MNGMADAHETRTAASVRIADFPGAAASRDTATYIAELTAELADLARTARLDFLAYLLEVAKLEAATSARDRTVARKRK